MYSRGETWRFSWTLLIFAVLVLYIASYVLHIGRLGFLVGSSGRTLAIQMELLAFVLAAATCVAARCYAALMVSVGAMAYVVFQAAMFSAKFGMPLNLNYLAGYFGLFSAMIFAPALRVLGPRILTDVLFGAAVLYAFFYLFLSLGVPGFTPPVDPEATRISIKAIADRPDRFIMLSGVMAFGVAVAVSRLLNTRRQSFRTTAFYAASLLLFSAGIWLSYSRVITAIIVVFAALYVVTRSARLVGLVSFVGFAGLSAVLVGGLLVPGFRPFAFLEPDPSAWARGFSYEVVRYFSRDNWLFGVGLASSRDDTVYITSEPMFFSGDLGSVGVFYEGGVVGLAIFVTISWLCTMSWPRLRQIGFSRRDSDALALAGAMCACYGIIAPDLWSGSSTLFAGLFLALWLYPRGSQEKRRSKTPQVSRRNDIGRLETARPLEREV